MDKIIPAENLRLRPANLYDALIMYKWAMDIEVRNNSINPDSFSFEHHLRWVQNKLNDSNCKIFILESLFPIGQIRFEKKEDRWIVSYLIDENFRNKGFGYQIIKIGLENMGRGQYLARVKKSNISSIKIFNKLNFREVKNDPGNDDIINFLFEKG
jgi:spore coat polysaccharide biosynthesis protein SpsF